MNELVASLADGKAHSVPRAPYLVPLHAQELSELRPVLEAIFERCDDIIAHWFELCRQKLHTCRLSPARFRAVFSSYLRSTARALLDNDFDCYADGIENLGHELTADGVTFAEITLTLHLCKRSISTVCASELSPERFSLLDNLTQIRTALLAESYFRPRTKRPAAAAPALKEQAPPADAGCESFNGLVGASPAMQRVRERIVAAARACGTVLLVGESGTGKELVARAIHNLGPGAQAPFVAVNCPAIPRDLIESELFGHRRGAFSGANLEHPGLFRAADGGTVLLDEITEMSLEAQSKLLRVLQERSVRPVGATSELAVEVRVIASTNRRPDEAVRMGLMRHDLYYRLQASVIEIPPLRERREDIPLLANHFVRLLKAKAARPVTGIGADAMAALLRYPWPGNVRELCNTIESAIIFGAGEQIGLDDLPAAIRCNEPVVLTRDDAAPVQPEAAARTQSSPAPQSFAESERELIERTLRLTGNNKTLAAELLRISRKKLYARLARYGLLKRDRHARRQSLLSSPQLSAVLN